jgi:hypothetical protein
MAGKAGGCMKKYRDRKPVVIPMGIEIQANQDHVVMIFPFDSSSIPTGKKGTIGIRFVSPEHLLETFNRLIEAACKVWPDNEWIKEYIREDD